MNLVYAQLKLVVDNEMVRDRTSPNNRSRLLLKNGMNIQRKVPGKMTVSG